MKLQVLNSTYILQARIIDLVNPSHDIYIQLYGLLKRYQPDITMDDVFEIVSKKGYSALEEEVNNYLASYDLDELQIQELYKQMVGEVGIQPKEFFQMSPEEMDWAYRGYLERKETDINLVLAALNKFNNNDFDLIRLVEDQGYTIGSIKERNEFFSSLGISEGEE